MSAKALKTVCFTTICVVAGCGGSGNATPTEAAQAMESILKERGVAVMGCELDVGPSVGSDLGIAFAAGRYICELEQARSYGDFGDFTRWCYSALATDDRARPTEAGTGVPAEFGCN